MSKKISIIIVHFKSEKILKSQLENFDLSKIEVIVVDNSQSLSKEYLPKPVKLISNPFNMGYSHACNQGLVEANNEWVLFLNPDVLITDEQIDDLLDRALDQDLDVASVKTVDEGYNKPIPSTFSLLHEFTFFRKILPQSLFTSQNKTLIGGLLLIKKSVLRQISGWDERFFLWFEDSDLSKRLFDQHYKVGYVDINVNHSGGYSLKRLEKSVQKDLFFNSMDIYARKYFGAISQKVVSFIKKKYSDKKIAPAMNEDIISVIVPNMKMELLDSFLENNLIFFHDSLELIIVSSALNHKNIWKYRNKYPNIRFIKIQKNLGFANSVNIGLRASTGKYVGTCNDDVILSEEWDLNLVEAFDRSVGSVNPIIFDTKNNIESAGIKILKRGKAFPIVEIPEIKAQIVDATNAACVLYNRDALIKTGLFDEKFGSYLEDIDLSLRLLKNGYSNLVVNTVKVVHQKHQTSGSINFNKPYHDFKNWLYVIAKNWSITDVIKNFIPILIERGRNISGMLKSIK